MFRSKAKRDSHREKCKTLGFVSNDFDTAGETPAVVLSPKHPVARVVPNLFLYRPRFFSAIQACNSVQALECATPCAWARTTIRNLDDPTFFAGRPRDGWFSTTGQSPHEVHSALLS